MRYVILLLCLIMIGCGLSTPHTESNLRIHRNERLSQLPSPEGSGHVAWTLQHDNISLDGLYRGSWSDMGTGSLQISGYFGMIDEPLSFIWDGHRQLSGSSIIGQTVTGSAFYGPRNQLNGPLPATIRFPLAHAKQITTPLTLLSMITTQTGSYHDDTLSLTGDTWTSIIDHDSISISYDKAYEFRISYDADRQLKRHHRYNSRSHTACTITDQRLQGTCTMPPPSSDAHLTHGPSSLKRTADLVLD